MEVEAGENWEHMREELELLRLVTLSAKEGAVQMTTEPTATQQKIFKTLSVASPERMCIVELASASLYTPHLSGPS